MNDIPLKQIIDASLSQIGKVADVNTVIGEPISTGDGITIVPCRSDMPPAVLISTAKIPRPIRRLISRAATVPVFR